MFTKRAFDLRGVAGLILICICGVQLAACGGKKDALVIFEVQTDPGVPSFAQFRFSAPGNAAVPPGFKDAVGNRPTFSLGYYMPVSGSVMILGEAVRDDGCVVGQGMATALGVTPGEITNGPTLSITILTTPRCAPDGGSPGSGGGNGNGGNGSGAGGEIAGGSGGAIDAGSGTGGHTGAGGNFTGTGGSSACAPPTVLCDTSCEDTTQDLQHCGDCNTACRNDQDCTNSQCVCPSGTTQCSGGVCAASCGGGTGGKTGGGTGGAAATGTGGSTTTGTTDCSTATTFSAICVPTCPNISDLELDIGYFGQGCPRGAWTLSTGGGGTTTPAAGSLAPVAVTDLAGSKYAIHVSGSGQMNATATSYNAYISLSASLNSPSSTQKGAVNASTYTGIKFMGKITGSVELHVPNVNTDPAGGKCSGSGAMQCSDDGKVLLPNSTAWTQYMIPFSTLMSSAPPFGNPAGTPFPTGQIYSIEWNVTIPATGPVGAWDIWIDNLAFY